MHASNRKKKPPEVFKRIKAILSTLGNKCAKSSRCGKLTILFSKKIFSCINYIQLLI